jgi:outer membrane protein OmpA-like peptidoglycan-associated protein
MKLNRLFPVSLIAIAMIAGCSTTPQNASLAEAHGLYNGARTNAEISNLAALELKQASDSLNKADLALSQGESEATVDQLAYLAKQQVAIARETAKRKSAEAAVAKASASSDRMRLDARTAEADAAKLETLSAQATAQRKSEELAVAQANASRNQRELAASAAEADTARREATLAQENARRDQRRLEATAAEADAARRQATVAQDAAALQAAALAVANANAERDQALIAQQEMQLEALNAKKTERGLVITLGDVLFRTNQSNLQASGTRNVQKLADFLKQYPRQKVLIEGHTDSAGSDSHNLVLSERRADSVRTALIDMGVGSERITTKGYGEAYPIAGNDTASNRQLNRRVEIILSDTNDRIAPRM